MAQTFLIDPELLLRAKDVGGELTADDKQAGGGERFPFYSVVGATSKDALCETEINGKKVKLSRAGEFRRKTSDGGYEYCDCLPSLVIVDAKTAQTLFEGGEAVCRGLSTSGFYKPKGVGGKMGQGADCETCPYNRFAWERNGGKRDGVAPGPGGITIKKEDLCNSTLQLYCWNVTTDETCIVQFSSSAFRHYKEIARQVEGFGAKMHSLRVMLSTEEVSNAEGQANSYIPKIEVLDALTPEQFERACTLRAQCIADAIQATGASMLPALPPPPQQAALPAARPKASAFDNVPQLVSAGPAPDDNDPFAGDDV